LSGERFVVLGLANVRSRWFRDVARWCTAGIVPIEFIKTVSIEELRARLRSGRATSAVLVDAGLSAVDRDLADRVREAGAALIVVDDGRTSRDWMELGASAVVSPELGRAALLDTLARVATPVTRSEHQTTAEPAGDGSGGWRGRLVVVTGANGAGVSTTAMATAQGLAEDARYAGMVLLCDLALHADQAMLHDARDVVPGVLELVEAHRGGRLSVDAVRALAFDVPERRYQLLLGLRRHRDWTAVRPRAFEAALDSLRRAYRVVVADTDSDVEGEAECGSLDVEERNTMARTATRDADLVLVVGLGGLKGLHALVRTIRDLTEAGVASTRIAPIVNRSSRGPRGRAEIAATLAALLPGVVLASPLHLPERRRLDDLLRDGSRLPASLSGPPARAVRALLERDMAAPEEPAVVPVVPGTLGSLTDEAPGEEAWLT
jgi:hypothetical protein